jgi:hypothetical protein
MSENISNTPQDAGASDREALLQEMLVRLNSFPGDPRVNNPQVLVGQIPEGLPFELPLPPDNIIVGTLIRGPESASIVLNVDQPAELVLGWYREHMKEAGVQELEMPGVAQRSGFTQTGIAAGMQATFCYGSRGPSLMVNTLSRDKDETKADVRLELDIKGMACKYFAKNRMQRPLFASLVPQLAPPPKSTQRVDSVGASSTFDSVHSIATLRLENDVNIVELATHYNTQLESGGWTRGDAGSDGPFAWSTWSFHDEDNELWRGSFLILKIQIQQPQYTLYIQANMDTGPLQGSGWFSSFGPMTML